MVLSAATWFSSNIVVYFVLYTFGKSGLTNRMTSAVSVMDDKYRESLQRHYRLLMTHIILTDDLIQQMAKEKILPETMIKDIQSADTRDERNEKLLNSLRLRGNKSYKKFRELMYRTGNFFVADLLWEEDGPGIMDEKDLSKFPGLMNCVQDNHKKKLLRYLDSKIREKALLMAWKEAPSERLEALQSKVIDFNQERLYRETIASQEEKIKMLEGSLQMEQEMSQSLQLEIQGLQQQIINLKRDHRSTMDTQTRFHDANLSTIARLKDKSAKMNKALAELIDLVKARVDLTADDGSDSSAAEDEHKIALLERNVRKLLIMLRKERDDNNANQIQREDVLKLVNRRYSKEPLVIIVKDVLKHEQKHRSVVMKDILKLAETLKHIVPSTTGGTSAIGAVNLALGPIDPATLDTKHFKSQLAMMKAQVEHVQKRVAWKDSEIEALRQEVLQLKSSPASYNNYSNTSSRDTSPTTSTSTQNVTSQEALSNYSASPTQTSQSQSQSSGLSPSSRSSSMRRGPSPGDKKFPDLRRVNQGSSKTVTFVETVRRIVASGKSSQKSKFATTTTSTASPTLAGDSDKTVVNIDQYLEEEEEEDDGLGEEVLMSSRSVGGEGDTTSASSLNGQPSKSTSRRSNQR